MKLRAKYARSHYKNDTTFLNAVYRRNKDIIDEKLGDIAKQGGVSPLQQFKFNVFEERKTLRRKGHKNAGLTQAMNKFTESARFTPQELHFKENVAHSLRKYKAMGVLRDLTKKSFNIDNLQYIGNKSYTYNGYIIMFDNSPKSLKIFKNTKMVKEIFKGGNQTFIDSVG